MQRPIFDKVPAHKLRSGWGKSANYRFDLLIDGDSFTTDSAMTVEIIKDRLREYVKAKGKKIEMTVSHEPIDGKWKYVMRFSM